MVAQIGGRPRRSFGEVAQRWSPGEVAQPSEVVARIFDYSLVVSLFASSFVRLLFIFVARFLSCGMFLWEMLRRP